MSVTLEQVESFNKKIYKDAVKMFEHFFPGIKLGILHMQPKPKGNFKN